VHCERKTRLSAPGFGHGIRGGPLSRRSPMGDDGVWGGPRPLRCGLEACKGEGAAGGGRSAAVGGGARGIDRPFRRQVAARGYKPRRGQTHIPKTRHHSRAFSPFVLRTAAGSSPARRIWPFTRWGEHVVVSAARRRMSWSRDGRTGVRCGISRSVVPAAVTGRGTEGSPRGTHAEEVSRATFP
jgi:hypothetical protein